MNAAGHESQVITSGGVWAALGGHGEQCTEAEGRLACTLAEIAPLLPTAVRCAESWQEEQIRQVAAWGYTQLLYVGLPYPDTIPPHVIAAREDSGTRVLYVADDFDAVEQLTAAFGDHAATVAQLDRPWEVLAAIDGRLDFEIPTAFVFAPGIAERLTGSVLARLFAVLAERAAIGSWFMLTHLTQGDGVGRAIGRHNRRACPPLHARRDELIAELFPKGRIRLTDPKDHKWLTREVGAMPLDGVPVVGLAGVRLAPRDPESSGGERAANDATLFAFNGVVTARLRRQQQQRRDDALALPPPR